MAQVLERMQAGWARKATFDDSDLAVPLHVPSKCWEMVKVCLGTCLNPIGNLKKMASWEP